MHVPMVNVRVMGVRVSQRHMVVGMTVRFSWRVIGQVLVLMVFVVHVTMVMVQRFVFMFVLMLFSQMQPNADAHQCRRAEEGRGEAFPKYRQRENCPDKRCQGKVGSRPRRTQMT